jgi:hypothetical protein
MTVNNEFERISLFRPWPGGTEENHKKLQSRYLMAQPVFEQDISQIYVRSVMASAS